MFIDLALTVAVIWFIGGASATYEVDGLGSAVAVAFAMAAAGWLLMIPMASVPELVNATVMGSCAPDCSDRIIYVHLAGVLLDFAINVPLLLVIGLFIPGVGVRGIAGAAAIGAILAVIPRLTPALHSVASAS